jgi:flagellar biosynthetic protein FliR
MWTYAINHYAVFLLVLLRSVAFIATAPVLSSRLWPTWAKLGFGAFMALTMTPSVHGFVPDPFSQAGQYIVVALQETLVGMLLGFGANLLFAALSVAGQAFDVQIGFGSATLFDPQHGGSSGLTASFLSGLFFLYFLGVNGLDGLTLALMNSYHFVGIGQFHFPRDAWVFMIQLLDIAMVLGIQVAAPLLAALLMTDITFAFLSRAVPQMNVFVVGLPAKLFVGLTLFAAIMPGIVYVFGLIFHQIFSQLNMLLQWLGG